MKSELHFTFSAPNFSSVPNWKPNNWVCIVNYNYGDLALLWTCCCPLWHYCDVRGLRKVSSSISTRVVVILPYCCLFSLSLDCVSQSTGHVHWSCIVVRHLRETWVIARYAISPFISRALIEWYVLFLVQLSCLIRDLV